MCFFSPPAMPGAPPAPPPLPASPTEVDPAVQAARDAQKRRTAAMRGYASTIATSALGTPAPLTTAAATAAAAGAKTVLGQ